MSDTTQFTIGTEARCADGVCGEVSRVVVDPVRHMVTHLVVEPKHRPGLARLVPVDLVEATSPEVVLRCTLDAFDQLDPAEEMQFVPGSVGYAAYGPEQVVAWPYYGLNPGAGQPGWCGSRGGRVLADRHLRPCPPGRGRGAARRPGRSHGRQYRAHPRAGRRPSRPSGHARAAAGGALVGPQGCGHPRSRPCPGSGTPSGSTSASRRSRTCRRWISPSTAARASTAGRLAPWHGPRAVSAVLGADPGDLHRVAASRVLAEEAAHEPPVVMLVLVDHGAGAAPTAEQRRVAPAARGPERSVFGTAELGMPAPR